MILSLKAGLAMTKTPKDESIFQRRRVFVITRLADEDVGIKWLLTATRSKPNSEE